MDNTIVLEFQNLQWAPYHSKWGYASGRLATINFPTKEECDGWCNESNKTVYTGTYKSIPLIHPHHVAEAKIIST